MAHEFVWHNKVSVRVCIHWIVIACSVSVAATTVVFLFYPISQGRFFDSMFLGIYDTFNSMTVFQAEHILMHL